MKHTSEDLSTAEVTEAGNWQVDDSLSLNPAADLSKQLVYPTFINTNGDFLTVITELDEGVLKLFSLKDYSFIEEFGRRGEGPGEFSSPPFKMNELPKHEPVISLLDWGKKSSTE